MVVTFLSFLDITYYVDAEIGFVCGIDYQNFPFLKDVCTLKMSSSLEPNTSIILKLAENPADPMQFLDNKKIRGYEVEARYTLTLITYENAVSESWIIKDVVLAAWIVSKDVVLAI